MIQNFKQLAVAAARSASDKKAEDVLLLNLSGAPSALADYVLMMSANSHVHLRTLGDAVADALEQHGLVPLHRDGSKSGHWLALDYGGLLVHVFHHQARAFYSLERLWPEAKKVRWELRHDGMPGGAKKPKAAASAKRKKGS